MMWSGRSKGVTLFMVLMLLIVPLASVPSGTLGDEVVPPSVPSVDPRDVQDALIKGLDWYSRNQGVDGGWKNSVGITGFVVLCFANAGYDYTNTSVQKALGFMRNFYNPMEGSMADSFLNYDTAISLVAMTAAGDPQDADKLVNMTRFLQVLQFEEEKQLYNVSEDWYIGGWPNYAGIPDVSNSQFGLWGLQASDLYTDVEIPGSVWSNATTFMRHCQNHPDTNPMEWAHNTSLPSQGDGGFVYNAYRSRTEAGELAFESYGSITAAGAYSYLLCGNDPRNPETAAATEWLNKEYTVTTNPRMAGQGHFYYMWTMSRALSIMPNEWIVDGSGKLHDWRPELATFFMDRQRSDGSWPGNPFTGWREEEPELEGIYAMLTLQAAYFMTPEAELTIDVEGGDEVTFVDGMGRELVSDVSSGLIVTERTLKCTDYETFRRVWVVAEGTEGSEVTISTDGAWGTGRSSHRSETLVLGKGGASALVATGSYTGPMAMTIIGFDRGPVLETKGKPSIEVAKGETEVVSIKMIETSGEGPAVGAMVIVPSGNGVIADVDVQGMSVPAGGEGALDLTISLGPDVKTGTVWASAIVSSTAPPVPVNLEAVEPDESWSPSATYWVILGLLMLAMVIFFILPNMGKPTVIDDYALDEE